MSFNEDGNWLNGRRCPECGQSARLFVSVAAQFELGDSGCRLTGDLEIGDDTRTDCPECGWSGTWSEADELSDRFLVFCERSEGDTYIADIRSRSLMKAAKAGKDECFRAWPACDLQSIRVKGVVCLRDGDVIWTDDGDFSLEGDGEDE